MKYTQGTQNEYDYETHARNYIAECPPSISGNGGHNAAFRVACVLVNGFDLPITTAKQLFQEYNQRCQPQWNDNEIDHKLNEASKAPCPEGKGFMRKQDSYSYREYPYNPKPVEIHDPFVDFLRSAFDADDVLSICDSVINEDGRSVPEHSGVNQFTRDEWINKYYAKDKDVTRIGFPSPTGAYIRINPVMKESKGSDKDVTKYRHVLVESDNLPKAKQEAILRNSGLPITCLIDSGGKSIHAWVRVDAKDREEYDERRKKIWDKLPELELDQQNKNPSRFSRLPCVFRNGVEQKLLGIRIGSIDYKDWLEKSNGMPQPITYKELESKKIDPPTPLIENILSRGEKLIFSGGSKTRKTWVMMDLAISIVSGKNWFGHKVHTGKVLYINFELTDYYARARLQTIFKGNNISSDCYENLSIWNLRSVVCEYHKMRSMFTNQIIDGGYSLVIIDPLYKLLGDLDENSAGDMNKLMSEITILAEETNSSICISHHHTKGSGPKKAIDSASGSGVFGRDPDVIVSMGESSVKGYEGSTQVDYIFRNQKPRVPHLIEWNEKTYTHDTVVMMSDKGNSYKLATT